MQLASRAWLAVVAVVLMLVNMTAAQTRRVGVVATLQGTATVERTSVPQPMPLKVRDHVFLRDRITTGEQSRLRLLLNGKALVNMLPLSVVTISEVPTAALIEVSGGQIAVNVINERMRPGECLEVKTPNAVANVCGTLLFTEVSQMGGSPSDITSCFTLLYGVVGVAVLDPATGRPGTTRFTLTPLQTLTVTGSTPPSEPHDITQAEAQVYKDALHQIPQPPPHRGAVPCLHL